MTGRSKSAEPPSISAATPLAGKSPFDLSFGELEAAGERAATAAREEADAAGVPVAYVANPTASTARPSDDQLIDLWLQGLSALQIGKILGVTRYTVISRVHRLGLSGRSQPGSQPVLRLGAQKAAGGAPTSTLPVPGHNIGHSVDAVVMTLGAHLCKWPIGDPSSDGFSFCGRRTRGENPYCVEHAKVAYAPVHRVERDVSVELRVGHSTRYTTAVTYAFDRPGPTGRGSRRRG